MKIIGSSKDFERMRKLKNILRGVLKILRLPNLTYDLKSNYDLLHCAHSLSLNKKPWVVDSKTYDRIAATGTIPSSTITCIL